MPRTGVTPDINYTDLGVDSSSRFPLRAWTNKQADKLTDGTESNTHATIYHRRRGQ